MPQHESFNSLEFPAQDLAALKALFSVLFGWPFVDYGPDCCAFTGIGMEQGLYRSGRVSSAAGGTILKSVFRFADRSRFHLADPVGNGLALWSDRT
ncbi:VOC family protein [Aestuariirhabdus litorea]|uniref:VOC family protein n=1 Tax=Aestuariirhabdus litorea TaxID=2528527 RepID=A0A3P3VMT1_9GAMM|nr:VOC family protein [Aestuariirhabdus litorea]RRJ83039.1 VOC family protein [Aestuariirhabdus litorea]RWW93197.1 VOC family protein [Endozoicomonadaceae bacterium GTF-13]